MAKVRQITSKKVQQIAAFVTWKDIDTFPDLPVVIKSERNFCNKGALLFAFI